MQVAGSHIKPKYPGSDIFRRVARYTRIVLVGKWALGAISLLILLVIIIIPLLNKSDGARISFVSSGTDSKGSPVMMLPKLQGVSGNNEPYTVTADRAVQKPDDMVDLFNVQADLFRANNAWIGLTAHEGVYNSASRLLTLTGDVTLFQDTGYSFTSQRVDIDTQKATASGDGQITGYGPLGNLDAMGYAIMDNGARMQFGQTGRVKVRIHNK